MFIPRKADFGGLTVTNEYCTDDVQSQTYKTSDHDEHGVLDTCVYHVSIAGLTMTIIATAIEVLAKTHARL